MLNDKICRVSATDASGYVRRVPVIATSRNEAAARAIEELIKAGEWSTGGDPMLQITVHEPGAVHQVSIEQVKRWTRVQNRADSIGIFALKSRVSKLLAAKRGQ